MTDSKASTGDSKNTVDSSTKKINLIYEFVKSLHETYPKNKPVALYARLLERNMTTDKHRQQQFRAFRGFLIKNTDAITHMDVTKLVYKKIVFAPNVYLDVECFLQDDSPDLRQAVWQYLCGLNMLFFPSDHSKELYKRTLSLTQQLGTADSMEGQLVEKAFDKIQSILPDSETAGDNPMSVLGTLLSSGAIGELMGDLQTGIASGQMDTRKLLNMAQTVLSNLNSQLDSEEKMVAIAEGPKAE